MVEVVRKRGKRGACRERGTAVTAKGGAPGRGYHRFQEMPVEHQGILYQMFLDGEPATEIARMIQEDWNTCQDVSRKALVRQLQRYRKDVIDPKILIQGKSLPVEARKVLLGRINKQLDTLDTMASVLEAQECRFLAAQAAAKGDARLEGRAGTELQRLWHMLKDLANLQIETGILRRAPKTVTAHVSFAQSAGEEAYMSARKAKEDQASRARSALDAMTQAGIIDGEFEVVRQDPQNGEEGSQNGNVDPETMSPEFPETGTTETEPRDLSTSVEDSSPGDPGDMTGNPGDDVEDFSEKVAQTAGRLQRVLAQLAPLEIVDEDDPLEAMLDE